jgi:hypothetical protein
MRRHNQDAHNNIYVNYFQVKMARNKGKLSCKIMPKTTTLLKGENGGGGSGGGGGDDYSVIANNLTCKKSELHNTLNERKM